VKRYVKENSITKALLIAAASMLIWTAGPAFAQNDDAETPSGQKGKPKKKGGLFKMFEAKTKELDPETQKKLEGVTAEAEKMLDTDEAGDAVKRATEAFRENKDEIIAEGRRLVENPEGAAEQGKKMAGNDELRGRLEAAAGDLLGEDTVAQARAKAEELAKSKEGENAAAQAREAIGSDTAAADAAAEIKPLLEEAVSTTPSTPAPPAAMRTEDKPPAPAPAGALQPLVGPDGVPVPKDPVTESIPRPNRDPKKMTRITAEKSEFDANKNVVTFEINVMLDHPEFDMSCDVLVAELQGDGNKQLGGTGEVSPTQQAASGGIERAEARGYVQIEKISPDGKQQVAIARLAVYEASTGDVILSVYPTLQDGDNLIRGKSEDTKILLKQDGTHKVIGLADYEFVSEKNTIEFKPRGGE
jgi:lipopolysaccharide export system protein LptA